MADLEENLPTPGRPPCTDLFEEAISAAQMYYSDMFVYPYTYQGGYFYRHDMIKDAFASWANAGQVLSKYDEFKKYALFVSIFNSEFRVFKIIKLQVHLFER